jgi:Pentapeptide repeats (8 copies)
MTKKKVVEIKSWLTNEVIATGEAGETLAELVTRKVAERASLDGANLDGASLDGASLDGASLDGASLDGANLYGANLYGASLDSANLDGANLYGASLYGANLYGANLDGANLYGANLYGANLYGANLYGATLYGASLYGASLYGASLYGANLYGANLPSPTAVLLATWGDLSPQLVADLMLYDSTCHPDPEAFQRWADGGGCPYDDVHVQRAANFSEKRSLWGKGQPCRPYDLMTRVLAEKCPAWDEKQVAEFVAKFKK